MTRKKAYKIALDAITQAQKQYYGGRVEHGKTKGLFEWAIKANKKWEEFEQAKNLLRAEFYDGAQLGLFATTPLLVLDGEEGID